MRKVLGPFLAMTLALVALLAGQAGAAPPPESDRPAANGKRYDPERVLVAFQPGTPAESRAEAHRRQGG